MTQQTLFTQHKRPKRLTGRKLKAGERSLKHLRTKGWTAEVAEKFVTLGGTQAQKAYIDELVEQRETLLRFVASLAADPTPDPAVMRSLLELPAPKPPPGVGGYRKDLFGFIDILAFRGDETLAVQTTSRQQMAAHLLKFRRDDTTRQIILDWLADDHRTFVIHGWQCVELPTKKGGVKAAWQVTERVVEAADLTIEEF